jgi:hypothetical protein
LREFCFELSVTGYRLSGFAVIRYPVSGIRYPIGLQLVIGLRRYPVSDWVAISYWAAMVSGIGLGR